MAKVSISTTTPKKFSKENTDSTKDMAKALLHLLMEPRNLVFGEETKSLIRN